MAFTANFYAFSKRINSTKLPSGAATGVSIVLKAGSSAINPTIDIDFGQSGNPTGFNYCYIPAFNRYYWVSDWVFNNRLWTARLKSDPLASFKSYIGAYSAYVTRAASNYDLRVVDNYYPAKAKNTHDASIIQSPFVSDLSDGKYIIGIQGKGSGGNGGAVTYYVATSSQMKALTNYLLQDMGTYEVEDISDKLLACIFNPMQFIVSCMWVPFSPPASNVNEVEVGWWTFSGTGMQRLASLSWGTNFSFTIPKHPKAATRGQYLNMPPYTRYKLEAGPWGVIPLDNFNMLDADSLSCDYRVDCITGSGRLNVKYRDELIYESIHTIQVGVPIQLGQNAFNQGALMNTISSVGNAGASLFSGNIVGALTNSAAAIGNAAGMTQAVPSSVGSNGTLSFNNIFGLMADFIDIVDEDLANRGRPLCKKVTISSLSGYLMCEDADPEIPCTDAELKEIVSYLNSGFYYE